MPIDDILALAQAEFQAGRPAQAVDALNGLLATTADPRAALMLGQILEQTMHPGEAIESYLLAARLGADLGMSAGRAARVSLDMGHQQQALALATELRQLRPGSPEAALVLANIGIATGNTSLVDSVKNDLVASDDVDALLLAVRLIGSDLRNERNLALFSKLRALYPDDPFIRTSLIGYAREFCDYKTLEREEAAFAADIAAGNFSALAAESPHYNLMWCGDEALNRLAQNLGFVTPPAPDAAARRHAMTHAWGGKIRVGYLSNDFWDDHATMRLFQSVLTAHDLERFEITLFCYTDERMLAFDSGNRKTWGRIVRIGAMDDAAAAEAIRAEGIDILVDLKGHTGGSRSGLMNLPIAPVQVQWLGFPGSCVNIDCDYVIGDRFVLPESAKPHYHEKFCLLPESYQPNDPEFRALPPPVSRRMFGLPEDRFVFAAFHSQRKNAPDCLALWAEVLLANPQSVLWIMCEGAFSRKSTADAFRRHGVKAGQLVFAPKTAYAPHIARVQAADLGLDSFPYNGHTTTSDMLWAGLPVATVKGSNFASRVSESLLNAIGLPELVATDRADFIRLCSELVANREELAALRQRIGEKRFIAPLFDAERFCRHLERAFETMASRAKAGLVPDHFAVDPLPPRTAPFR